MCIFSRGVSRVSATRIFARPQGGDRQVLAYAMNAGIEEELAMVLPIPVVPGGGDDAVAFINLESYPDLFEDLERAFVRPRQSGPFAPLSASMREDLAVHDVGAFVASYVPSPRDFDRLDPQFRLPAPVLTSHADYADWGFAVFQLRPRSGIQSVHPMAFSFPSRRPGALFFPTLHVHDGATVPAEASFDHTFVCQTSEPVFATTLAWETSDKPVGKFVNARRAKHVVDPDAVVRRSKLVGKHPNVDTWLDPPPCAGPHVLHGRGDRFTFDLRVGAAYDPSPGDARASRWRDTSRTRIDELHAGMMQGLAKLTADQADAWQLVSVDEPKLGLWARIRGDEIAKLFISSGLPTMFGIRGFEVVKAGTPGPFAIEIGAAGEHVERQYVSFGFRVAPGAERIAEIERALAELLDRAVS